MPNVLSKMQMPVKEVNFTMSTERYLGKTEKKVVIPQSNITCKYNEGNVPNVASFFYIVYLMI